MQIKIFSGKHVHEVQAEANKVLAGKKIIDGRPSFDLQNKFVLVVVYEDE